MILVVDDEPQVLAVLCEQLKTAGYAVEGVGRGLDAIDRLYRGDVKLVILDVNMSGVDGPMVLDCLKSHPLNKVIPVIMITGMPSPDVKQKALECGARFFLTKPASFSTLKEKVVSLIGAPPAPKRPA